MDQIITISKREKGEKISLNTLDCTRIKLHLSSTLKGIEGSPRGDAPCTRIFSKKVIVKRLAAWVKSLFFWFVYRDLRLFDYSPVYSLYISYSLGNYRAKFLGGSKMLVRNFKLKNSWISWHLGITRPTLRISCEW